ncbi:unnamed protein product [Timema podura]|uniref:Uncharacterized protein n=1 Tax=Timema podura TaxID=61482 RepID=A0ABN7NIK8_TIMPD|nr:unnamed protein product [Timema podura]
MEWASFAYETGPFHSISVRTSLWKGALYSGVLLPGSSSESKDRSKLFARPVLLRKSESTKLASIKLLYLIQAKPMKMKFKKLAGICLEKESTQNGSGNEKQVVSIEHHGFFITSEWR